MNSVTISGENLEPNLMLKMLAESTTCPFSDVYKEEHCEDFELSAEDCIQCIKKQLHFSVPQVGGNKIKVTISGTPKDCSEFIENLKSYTHRNGTFCLFLEQGICANQLEFSCSRCIDENIVIENEEDTE